MSYTYVKLKSDKEYKELFLVIEEDDGTLLISMNGKGGDAVRVPRHQYDPVSVDTDFMKSLCAIRTEADELKVMCHLLAYRDKVLEAPKELTEYVEWLENRLGKLCNIFANSTMLHLPDDQEYAMFETVVEEWIAKKSPLDCDESIPGESG